MQRLEKLAPQTGTSFEIKKGQTLKVIDPHGQQVADLFCADSINKNDGFSSGRTIDYNDTIFLTKGHRLYAHSGKALLEISEDTCGLHDVLVTPCSLQMFQMIAQNEHYHPSCLENLAIALKDFGIKESQVTATFNIFMNVSVHSTGAIRIGPPKSKAMDFITLRACCDVVIGLTACSDEATNNGCCKQVHYEILNA